MMTDTTTSETKAAAAHPPADNERVDDQNIHVRNKEDEEEYTIRLGTR